MEECHKNNTLTTPAPNIWSDPTEKPYLNHNH